MRDNQTPPTLAPISPGGFEVDGLNLEQWSNTQALLEVIANTYNTPYAVVLLDQHALTRNTYAKEWDPLKQEMVNRIEDGKKVVLRTKGIDMCNPVVFDICTGNELYGNHTYIYGKPGHRDRPSLAEIVLASSKTQCYLYYPTLMVQRSPMQPYDVWDKKANKQITKYKWTSYNTSDIAAARCLWLDLDGHHLADDNVVDTNLKAIDQLLRILPDYCAKTNIPMPAIVNSGRGVHLYWWFGHIVPLTTDLQQSHFGYLLYTMGKWATRLIEADPILSQIWKVDHSGYSLLRMLHLPGCIHPKLGVRRYAVNALWRDYNLCNYEELVSAINALDAADAPITPAIVCDSQAHEIPKPKAVTPSNPASAFAKAFPPTPTTDPDDTTVAAPAAEDCDTTLDSVPVQDTVADTDIQPRVSRRRLDRLLDWAEGRKWELMSVRELFLFCCAVLMQHMGTQNITQELQRLNAIIKPPLPAAEVANIVSSLDRKASRSDLPYVGYYIITNAWIVQNLHMTAEEEKQFCTSGHSVSTHSTVTFQSKFREFISIIPRDPAKETADEHRKRVAAYTHDWLYKHYEGYDRNTARQRRRSQHPEYNGRPGRYKKDNSELQRKCLALREEGFSERQISQKLQISKSTVHRLISEVVQKTEE